MTSIKYYTHFVLHCRSSCSANEYLGVIEVNYALSRGDMQEAAALLARNLECESKDIQILLWSRVH
jgi:hypothetical protein